MKCATQVLKREYQQRKSTINIMLVFKQNLAYEVEDLRKINRFEYRWNNKEALDFVIHFSTIKSSNNFYNIVKRYTLII